MPRGDGTGPAGLGPLSGRARGYCSGYAAPGMARSIGLCFGAGLGLGFRRMFGRMGKPHPAGYTYGAGVPGVSEQELLADEAKLLEKRLELIKARQSQLKGDE